MRFLRERVQRRQQRWEEKFEREEDARREKHGPDNRLWAYQRLAMNLLALVVTTVGGVLCLATMVSLVDGDNRTASYLLLAAFGFLWLGQFFAWLHKHMR